MTTDKGAKAPQSIEKKRKQGAIRSQRLRDKRNAEGLKEIRNIFASDDHEHLIREFSEKLKNGAKAS